MAENENEYVVTAQRSFETIVFGAGERISSEEYARMFKAVRRHAAWYAKHENDLYHRPTVDETKTLQEWFRHWFDSGYTALFNNWVWRNLVQVPEEPPLFALTEEDAQRMASQLSLPPVTREQMERVRKWVDASFDDWSDILETAVVESKKELEAT